jgi:hypothetical protein
MATIDTQPINKNFLSQLGFKFVINKTPNINYFVQSINIPGITLGSSDLQTPLSRLPIAGDQLQFGEIDITFKVDEDMQNYLELYNWLIAIGFPDNFDQFKGIDKTRNGPISGLIDPMTGQGVYSDATLTILSSAMNPIHQVNYLDCYPLTIGDLQFNSMDTDVNYLTCQASFRCRKFEIISL